MYFKVLDALDNLFFGWVLTGGLLSMGGPFFKPILKIEIKLYFMNCSFQGHLEIEQFIKCIFV